MIELLLLFFLTGEQQTVYNFDIYSGEKVEPASFIQNILEGRKKSTTDYTGKSRPDFYMVSELPIFDKDFKITYYTHDPIYGYSVDYEFNPYRNLYISQYLGYN